MAEAVSDQVLIEAAIEARKRAARLKREVRRESCSLVSDAISAALDGGVPRAKLAEALGVSIPRLYQLRDARS